MTVGWRWLSVDPLSVQYPSLTPYNFTGNMPISAYDPDGKVIIFINGYYGAPTGACCPASKAHWGNSWISKAKKQIGDNNDLYFDGSMGGLSGVIKDGEPGHAGLNLPESSLSAKVRRAEGYKVGRENAKTIIDNLSEGETIKFVTSSMGAAFQRGFSQALVDYKNEHNAEVAVHNMKAVMYNKSLAELKAANPDNDEIQSMEEMALRYDWIEFEIELVIDLDPMQGKNIGADPNASKNYYALNNKSLEEYDNETADFMELLIGSAVPNSTEIGKGQMKGHHPSNFPTSELPESKNKNKP